MTITINNEVVTLDESIILDSGLSEALEQAGYPYGIECEIVNGGEYVVQTIVSPHNNEKLMDAIIDQADAEYEKAKKELTLTGQYHDWSNTTADVVMDIISQAIEEEEELAESEEREPRELTIADLDEQEDVSSYNQFVESYNQYHDMLKLEQDTVLSNRLIIGIY